MMVYLTPFLEEILLITSRLNKALPEKSINNF